MASKPKPCNLTRILASEPENEALYARLREIVNEHHPHLASAEIALFYRDRWKPNKRTGQVTLGKAKVLSAFEREYTADAGAIILNADVWVGVLTETQQDAVLDHYLSFFDVAEEEDERGRLVLVKKSPDVVDFAAVIRRRGLYLDDLKAAAKAMMESQDAPLLAGLASQDEATDTGNNYPRAAEVG